MVWDYSVRVFIPTCLQVYTSSASTISLNKSAAILKVRKHTEHSYQATCHKAGRTHSTLPLAAAQFQQY